MILKITRCMVDMLSLLGMVVLIVALLASPAVQLWTLQSYTSGKDK
jgi:hypothetical protein